MKPLLIVAALLYLMRSKPSPAAAPSTPATTPAPSQDLISAAPAPIDTTPSAPAAPTLPADYAIDLAIVKAEGPGIVKKMLNSFYSPIPVPIPGIPDGGGKFMPSPYATLEIDNLGSNPAVLKQFAKDSGYSVTFPGMAPTNVTAYIDATGNLVGVMPAGDSGAVALNPQGLAVAPSTNYNLFDPNTLVQI